MDDPVRPAGSTLISPHNRTAKRVKRGSSPKLEQSKKKGKIPDMSNEIVSYKLWAAS